MDQIIAPDHWCDACQIVHQGRERPITCLFCDRTTANSHAVCLGHEALIPELIRGRSERPEGYYLFGSSFEARAFLQHLDPANNLLPETTP